MPDGGAGRGEDVAVVDVEHVGVEPDAGVPAAERLGVAPVGRGRPPVEEPGAGQDVGAGADRGDPHAGPAARRSAAAQGGAAGTPARRAGARRRRAVASVGGHDHRVGRREWRSGRAATATREVGVRRDRPPSTRAGHDLVQGPAVGVAGGAEHPRRDAQLEREDAGQAPARRRGGARWAWPDLRACRPSGHSPGPGARPDHAVMTTVETVSAAPRRAQGRPGGSASAFFVQDARSAVDLIQRAEDAGVDTAWMVMHPAGYDTPTLAAAALAGTDPHPGRHARSCPSSPATRWPSPPRSWPWPSSPPGRFRLGVGTSNLALLGRGLRHARRPTRSATHGGVHRRAAGGVRHRRGRPRGSGLPGRPPPGRAARRRARGRCR